MNAPEKLPLPDIQGLADDRALAIDRVGVKGIRHPMKVGWTDAEAQHTIAMIDMSVALPEHVKGTHMSRFLEILAGFESRLDAESLKALSGAMLERLEADSGSIALRFPYFMSKRAPVSGVESLMDYEVTLRVTVTPDDSFVSTEVVVPVTSLCPCSKEISAYGAHNQRSHVTITVTSALAIPPADLIAIAEAQASCELYGLLKRPDEKFVTERAYDNPKFVEDLVRDVALSLERDPRVLAFKAESENFESIHNHSAYACIERDKRVKA